MILRVIDNWLDKEITISYRGLLVWGVWVQLCVKILDWLTS